MKAVILCAGNGTRLKHLTQSLPKVLVEVSGRPILSYLFDSLPSQITEVCLVIQKETQYLFEEFLNKYNANNIETKFAYQPKGDNWGTYYAVLSAKDFLAEEKKFLVLNGDDIFLKEDLRALLQVQAPAYGLSLKKLGQRYRTCDLDKENKTITSFRLQKKEEKKRVVPCFSGALTLTQNFFMYEPVLFENKEAGLPHTLFASGDLVHYLMLKKWYQVNTLEDLVKVEASIKNKVW